LDDAPLEERRTGAVRTRRFLSPEDASDLGRLSSEAIDAVRGFAWPLVRDADELHDALMSLGVVAPDSDVDPAGACVGEGWFAWFEELVAVGRGVRWKYGGRQFWGCVERLSMVRPLHCEEIGTDTVVPERFRRPYDSLEAAVELVRGRLEVCGPTTAAALAQTLGVDTGLIDQALASLEGEGFVMRGRYTGHAAEEWCERRLLARIHRRTLSRLRDSVRPVSAAAFVRFLTRAHGVTAGNRRSGHNGLLEVIREMEGFAAPVAAWEAHIFPARVDDYDPALLDMLCHSGRVTWRRGAGSTSTGPVRTTAILFAARDEADLWAGEPDLDGLSHGARAVYDALDSDGALFFGELKKNSRLLGAQAEDALSELVARGAVVSDGFAGLRALVASGREKGKVCRSTPVAAGVW
jgi:ATP-dependent Lhr-like helicase